MGKKANTSTSTTDGPALASFSFDDLDLDGDGIISRAEWVFHNGVAEAEEADMISASHITAETLASEQDAELDQELDDNDGEEDAVSTTDEIESKSNLAPIWQLALDAATQLKREATEHNDRAVMRKSTMSWHAWKAAKKAAKKLKKAAMEISGPNPSHAKAKNLAKKSVRKAGMCIQLIRALSQRPAPAGKVQPAGSTARQEQSLLEACWAVQKAARKLKQAVKGTD